ncbi:MAG: carboxypeptidase regulatory-like domain-containing protein, partial [bacterium]|nr:carboxypeptidase regulatory-like domain-containing protein [bacterium]
MKQKLTATIALLLLCASPVVWAQTQAQLTGTAYDDSGAVVPAADILLRNTDTGVVLTTQTNESGIYAFLQVQPGPYEVSCEFPGFKKTVRGGLVLETGTNRSVDLTLEVGAVTESVEVIAATPLLETESNNVGQLIERSNVENMPLQSRRSAGLVRLMGNVVYAGDPGSEAAPRYTMAGGRPVNQMTLLDGGVVQNMTLGVPQQLVNPPAESLQEFKISASNHSAEFGR